MFGCGSVEHDAREKKKKEHLGLETNNHREESSD